MARVTICDICGAQISDGGFQTMDGKDICTKCMEKLVAEYFSRGTILPEEKEQKFEEILESASAKEKLPSKKKRSRWSPWMTSRRDRKKPETERNWI